MFHLNSTIGTKSESLPVEPESGASMADSGASVSMVGVGAGTGATVVDSGAFVAKVGVGARIGATVADAGVPLPW